MNKPTVFISHSSKDDLIVRALSAALRKKTGGAIEIFVSSDGQSIPLGRNWVHSIEDALNRASLMFVILSPNSISSQWIYFEAGYSYSQNRKVIPIGIPGVDLSVLSPPMSLLQGFNVTTPQSLDNLLVLINKEFGHSHDATFTQAEYDAIFGQAIRKTDPFLHEFADWIDYLRVSVRLPFYTFKPHIERILTAAKVEYRASEYDVVTHGARYRVVYNDPHDRPVEERLLDIDMDPSLASRNLRLLELISASYIAEAQLEIPPDVSLRIFFEPWANYVKEIHRLTARLLGSGIRLGEHNDFVYKDRSFYLSRGYDYESADSDGADRVELNLYLPADRILSYDLIGLLRTLFHHNILLAT